MTTESNEIPIELAKKLELKTKPIKAVSEINLNAVARSKTRMKTDDAFIVLDRRCKDFKDRLGKTKMASEVASIKSELNSVLKELSDLQYRFGKLDKLAGGKILILRREASLLKGETIKSDGTSELSYVTISKTVDTQDGTLVLYSDKTFQLVPRTNPISTTDSTENELTTHSKETPY